ncbi:MAG: hypothetical protein K6E45_00405 [Bacteroidaceae bacterium]|nr:hypothetical protein [Bacteroidaceae bacterium]
MKKYLFITAVILTISVMANAQLRDDKNMFNHMSLGLNLGTGGIGLEVGTVCTPYLGIRAGFEAIPSFTVSPKGIANIHVNLPADYQNLPEQIKNEYPVQEYMEFDGKGKVTMKNGKFLVDIFPGKNCMFHFTMGLYAGTRQIGNLIASQVDFGTEPNLEVVERYNSDVNNPTSQVYGRSPIDVNMADGTPLFYVGNAVPAEIRVNPVKPYFGIGVGRTVPRKRVGVKGELGVMYWGTPQIYNGLSNITECEEIHDVTKVSNKLPVYPMLKITIFGRLF